MILNLNKESAAALYKLLHNVGGDPNGPRGALDEIYEELSKFSFDLNQTYVDKFNHSVYDRSNSHFVVIA